jgi:hypothetical protein
MTNLDVTVIDPKQTPTVTPSQLKANGDDGGDGGDGDFHGFSDARVVEDDGNLPDFEDLIR